jgi:hypothetical protein
MTTHIDEGAFEDFHELRDLPRHLKDQIEQGPTFIILNFDLLSLSRPSRI